MTPELHLHLNRRPQKAVGQILRSLEAIKEAIGRLWRGDTIRGRARARPEVLYIPAALDILRYFRQGLFCPAATSINPVRNNH